MILKNTDFTKASACIQTAPNWFAPKCCWTSQPEKRENWLSGLSLFRKLLHSNCSQLVLHISLVLIWSQVSRTVRSNEVEITEKYRKFDNTSFRGKRGQGLHELIPQLRTQKYILEADSISIFLVHVPKDNFTLEIRNHSRDRNVLVTCLLKVS